LILLDVSIIVNGVEYPILIPHSKQASSVKNKLKKKNKLMRVHGLKIQLINSEFIKIMMKI